MGDDRYSHIISHWWPTGQHMGSGFMYHNPFQFLFFIFLVSNSVK